MVAKPTASSIPSAREQSHLSKSAEVAGASHEELVQTLVTSLESSFSPAKHDHALEWATRLFRDLDEPTLRGLVYRYGLFEEPVKVEEDRPVDLETLDE
jgi:hypothetical protein